jgi:hypothetical protein
MLVASEPITGADTPVDVIVGLGVLLVFAGIVVRAIAARWPSRGRACTEPGPERRGSRPASCTTEPPEQHLEDLASRRGEPVAEAPEPELFRLTAKTLAPLARLLDKGRRLGAAEDRIARELAALPDGFWLVERNVLVDGRRIPLLVIGATGAFLICASDGAWTLQDLHVMSELGDQLRQQLPGYDGQPHAAVCLAFDEMKPRAWFGGEELRGHGGWVLGVDWLQRWIFGFGSEQGLGNGDIRRLDDASGPFWNRRSTARLPATPNFG